MRARWLETWEANTTRWSVILVVAVALAASVGGLANLFAYDDIPILVNNAMVTELHGLGEYLGDSYWGPTRGNALYRPLTIIAFALEWAIGDGSAFPFHLANVVLYAVTAVLVLGLFRRLLPDGAALVGALAFAAHPVHVESVANVVGQSEMWAAIPMLIAITAYVRDRQRGPLRMRTAFLICACLIWALLHKEHGIVLPALLLMAEVTFRGHGFAQLSDDTGAQWMLARLMVLIVVGYLVIRIAILGGFAGDEPHPAIAGMPMGPRLWVMLGLVPEFVRLFFWPARLHPDYSPRAIPFLDAPALGHLPGGALLVAALALFIWAWRRDRVIAFALLWMGVTMGPTANILIPTGVLVAERTLFFPSLGAVLLLGRLVQLAWPHIAELRSRWVRFAVPATGGLILAAATAFSADRQLVWADNPTLFATMVIESPDDFRGHFALGALFGAGGSWDRAETHLVTADSLFPHYDLIGLSLAQLYQSTDRCAKAIRMYDSVLVLRADAEVAFIGRTVCQLEIARYSDARDASVQGVARGLSSGLFRMLLQKAESALVARDTVDARNRWWRAGKPTSKSDIPLRVPVIQFRPAPATRSRKVPEPVP